MEIMSEEKREKLVRIAQYYGKDTQLCKTVEELGEAMSALGEVMQLWMCAELGGKDMDLQERVERMVSELADVSNMTDQILYLYDMQDYFEEAKQKGIDKTIKRIEEEQKCDMD